MEQLGALLSTYVQSVPEFGSLSLNAKLTVIGLLVLSLGVHEAAHAWVALKCGDTTARDEGRITLNPIAHIDPFWTILLPTVLVLTTGFAFGGAKPVKVVFQNLRHPYRDMALVALAGPASNFLIAICFYFAWYWLGVSGIWTDKALPAILIWAALWNMVLAAFNLLPIPPLDGSRVLAWLLPSSLRGSFQQIGQFGMLIIFGLLYFGILNRPLNDAIGAMGEAIHWIVTLGGLW